MPDSTLRDHLVQVIRDLDSRPTGGLKSLGIICRVRRWGDARLNTQTSPLVDDKVLTMMAAHLRSLRKFTLWGCTRTTSAGVFAVLNEADYLEELSLDAIPHSVRSATQSYCHS